MKVSRDAAEGAWKMESCALPRERSLAQGEDEKKARERTEKKNCEWGGIGETKGKIIFSVTAGKRFSPPSRGKTPAERLADPFFCFR